MVWDGNGHTGARRNICTGGGAQNAPHMYKKGLPPYVQKGPMHVYVQKRSPYVQKSTPNGEKSSKNATTW